MLIRTINTSRDSRQRIRKIVPWFDWAKLTLYFTFHSELEGTISKFCWSRRRKAQNVRNTSKSREWANWRWALPIACILVFCSQLKTVIKETRLDTRLPRPSRVQGGRGSVREGYWNIWEETEVKKGRADGPTDRQSGLKSRVHATNDEIMTNKISFWMRLASLQKPLSVRISQHDFEGFLLIFSSHFSYIILYRKKTHILDIFWPY